MGEGIASPPAKDASSQARPRHIGRSKIRGFRSSRGESVGSEPEMFRAITKRAESVFHKESGWTLSVFGRRLGRLCGGADIPPAIRPSLHAGKMPALPEPSLRLHDHSRCRVRDYFLPDFGSPSPGAADSRSRVRCFGGGFRKIPPVIRYHRGCGRCESRNIR